MKFLRRFFDGVQRDFRLFLFMLILLEIYRAIFIALMSGYIGAETDSSQILTALWMGLRLSLKTAGAVTLVSFVFVTLTGLNARLRLFIGLIASLIFSTLFMARFPYYREFNSTFGLEILRGLNEDAISIIATVVQEYGLFWRFPVAMILSVICVAILSRIMLLKTFSLPYLDTTLRKVVFTSILVAAIGFFAVFVRFGGSLTYSNGVNWENAGVTSDDFLNECILDDAQALYRVKTMSTLMDAGEIDGVDKNKIVESVQFLSPRQELQSDNLAKCLERAAKGERIKKPRHIFIIIGETWMQWPMLGKYEKLHVADGIKSLIAEDNCYYTRNFMPNGDFTFSAVTGLVTGIPDLKIQVNYQLKTYDEVYFCAMPPPLKELGYKVDFWYGGAPTWENISKMSLAQGFDNFYGLSDIHAPRQTVWGAKDGDLFAALKAHLSEEPPTVHLILTTTNHPPYNLDLEEEGFDFQKTLAEVQKLPDIDDAEQLTKELGHYWYMDKVTTEFVRDVQKEYPDSLFVITGDHARRVDPSTRPTLFEHDSVPFVLYGEGIRKNIMPADTAGDHISIVPTIIELVAPKGFTYSSIAPSLFDSDGVGFNSDIFITRNTAGVIFGDAIELLPHVASSELLNQVSLSSEREMAEKVVSAMRTVGWWLIVNGETFK